MSRYRAYNDIIEWDMQDLLLLTAFPFSGVATANHRFPFYPIYWETSETYKMRLLNNENKNIEVPENLSESGSLWMKYKTLWRENIM